MANSSKPWRAEYAKSGRSYCKTCKTPIDKHFLRLGEMVQSHYSDGFMRIWNHADCILKRGNQIKSLKDVEGIELLRREDQQKIKKYVESGGPQNNPPPANMESGIEVSQTSRATCRCCNQKIMKGQVRVSTKPDGQGARSLVWHHASCFIDLSSTTQVKKLSGWDSLSASDKKPILTLVNKKRVPSSKRDDIKPELHHENASLQQSTSKGGAKRKKAVNNSQKSKIAKRLRVKLVQFAGNINSRNK